MMTTKINPTDSQLAFIATLTERVGQENADSLLLDNFSVVAPQDLDRRQASQFIDLLKTAQRKGRSEKRVVQEAIAAVTMLETGMYMRDGVPVRVYPAQNGGHLLAKALINGEWVYQGAASRFVNGDQRMDLEEAIKFGLDFGICACCGRTLTNPDSIREGIGPICRTKYFA